MKFKKKHLKDTYGAIDTGRLAAILYEAYHGKIGIESRNFPLPYEKSDDEVVQHFRRYASYVTDLAYEDAKHGHGSIYYKRPEEEE